MQITKQSGTLDHKSRYLVEIDDDYSGLNEADVIKTVVNELKNKIVDEMVEKNFDQIKTGIAKELPKLIKEVGQEIVIAGVSKIVGQKN